MASRGRSGASGRSRSPSRSPVRLPIVDSLPVGFSTKATVLDGDAIAKDPSFAETEWMKYYWANMLRVFLAFRNEAVRLYDDKAMEDEEFKLPEVLEVGGAHLCVHFGRDACWVSFSEPEHCWEEDGAGAVTLLVREAEATVPKGLFDRNTQGAFNKVMRSVYDIPELTIDVFVEMLEFVSGYFDCTTANAMGEFFATMLNKQTNKRVVKFANGVASYVGNSVTDLKSEHCKSAVIISACFAPAQKRALGAVDLGEGDLAFGV